MNALEIWEDIDGKGRVQVEQEKMPLAEVSVIVFLPGL